MKADLQQFRASVQQQFMQLQINTQARFNSIRAQINDVEMQHMREVNQFQNDFEQKFQDIMSHAIRISDPCRSVPQIAVPELVSLPVIACMTSSEPCSVAMEQTAQENTETKECTH